jgi:trk system potassium uptake protein
MLYREISRVLGQYLFYFAFVLFIPLGLAGYYEFIADPASHPQPHTTAAFLATICVCVAFSGILRYLGRKVEGTLYRREALAVAAIIWFITAGIGGLPFYFSGTLESPVDSYFEAMSGLTTTGATIMHPKVYDVNTGEEVEDTILGPPGTNVRYSFHGSIKPVRDPDTGEERYIGVEAVSKALLYWRSFMQWLGGMGIVVLLVAILPALGVGGKMLYQAEVPGPTKEAITPRIKETASVLWKLYLGVTIAEIVLLMVTNEKMPLYDAMVITFSNLSTGGFSVRNASIGAYNNPATEWVVMIFMIVGSINFALYFFCLKGKIYRIYEPEFLIYMCTLVLGASFVIYNLVGTEKQLLIGDTGIFSLSEAVRYGAFHYVSAQTSTGYVTANYDIWPYANQVLMLIVMFVGSMSGSTGGGIKIARHYVVFRVIKNTIESIFRPETVRAFQLGEHDVERKAGNVVVTYVLIVIIIALFGTFFMIVDGIDPETSVSINACMINNIGIAFRAAGPAHSFAFLSPASKILSTFLMVLGRLEFFAVLIIFVPAFWKGK